MRPPRSQTGKVQRYRMLLVGAGLLILAFIVGMRFGTASSAPPGAQAVLTDQLTAAHSPGPEAAHTLVVYIFSKTDTEYEDNLMFFLKWGVQENDGCDYVFILQDMDGVQMPDLTGKLPPNARVERHQNGCYDWGTIGWLFDTKKVDTSKYKYFIFMNSSVRGPFIPTYGQGFKRWHEQIVSRITDKVKLVGPTISCEGSPKDGNIDGEWRTNPHVQSYVLATDQVGLKLMQDDGKVFACYVNMWDTIFYSELGSSLAILRGGYNLDSFMVRYQDVDWTNEANWECNSRVNPYGESYYDGISLTPFEVMFVKVKGVLLHNEWSYARTAIKYDQWYTERAKKGHADVVKNIWKSNPWPLKAAKIAYSRARGSRCFDVELYRTHNADLKHIRDPVQLWEHYVTLGQFEGRPFQFNCENKIE
jgi:hypothetical protein